MNQNFVYQESLHFTHQDIEIDLSDSNQHNFYISLSNQSPNYNNTSEHECDFKYNYEDVLITSSKIDKKQQAFENFSKSKQIYQHNSNIQITLFDNNNRNELIPLERNQKTVHFNLENNKILLITNFDAEYYMNFEERKSLYQPFSIYKQQVILEEEDLSNDEDDEQYMQLQNNSTQAIAIRDKSLKGILKQNIKKVETVKQNEIFVMNIMQQNFDIPQEATMTERKKQLLEKKIQDHQYGMGLKFLKKYGFECGSGLGLKKQGILEPVQAQKISNFSQNVLKQQKCLSNVDFAYRKQRKIELITDFDDEQEKGQSGQQIKFPQLSQKSS
ncbi:unnamed protein product [Paramecium octaurelia]|uniref:G-patch domain-containing protein n=1 Tax=Paramecium octaurelia TaxID=43137 RepID=A0A8S1UG16_PAROT|nr:unnamed protein product [Paramecium octaurelia]